MGEDGEEELFGIHRFMKKKYVTGFIWLFTAGLFGIGWIVDVCIAFGNMVKGGEKEGDKSGQAGLVNPTGAGQAGLMVQPQTGRMVRNHRTSSGGGPGYSYLCG